MAGGRPTIITPEILHKLEEAFALGCSDLEACFFADIGKSTLYNYQNKNPEFVERKEELKQSPVFEARKSVINGLKDDPKLALAYLERKKKDEFSLRQEVAVKSTDEFTEFTDDELENRIESLKGEIDSSEE